MTGSYRSFTQMLLEALAERLAPGASGFADMFADDGVFGFTYPPPGMARLARGRAGIQQHLASLVDFTIDEVWQPVVRSVEGRNAVILEFEARGRNTRMYVGVGSKAAIRRQGKGLTASRPCRSSAGCTRLSESGQCAADLC